MKDIFRKQYLLQNVRKIQLGDVLYAALRKKARRLFEEKVITIVKSVMLDYALTHASKYIILKKISEYFFNTKRRQKNNLDLD